MLKTNFITSQTAPLMVHFGNLFLNSREDLEFNDGVTSTDIDSSHTYKTAGFYTINLTATNGNKSNIAAKILQTVQTGKLYMANLVFNNVYLIDNVADSVVV